MIMLNLKHILSEWRLQQGISFLTLPHTDKLWLQAQQARARFLSSLVRLPTAYDCLLRRRRHGSRLHFAAWASELLATVRMGSEGGKLSSPPWPQQCQHIANVEILGFYTVRKVGSPGHCVSDKL